MIERYVRDYEFDSGESHHLPSETESMLIYDAIVGLVDSDAFRAQISPKAAPVGVPDGLDERRKFEKWRQNWNGKWPRPADPGEWEAWQARAMLAASPSAPPLAAQDHVAWDVLYSNDDRLANTVRTQAEADRYAKMAYYVKPLYYTAHAAPAPAAQEAITEHAAYQMGATGADPTEFERLLFEAWMRGHCWKVVGEWDGRTYIASGERGGQVDRGAMLTRQLWAAWRDRAALAGHTAPPAAEQPEPAASGWRDMGSAPKDSTLIRLLVEFEDHATEDEEGPAVTIGFNALENDQIDKWHFAGWCWTHDRFTDGVGTPIGWLPLVAAAEQPDTVKVRDLLELVMRCDITGGGVLAAQRAASALLGKDGGA